MLWMETIKIQTFSLRSKSHSKRSIFSLIACMIQQIFVIKAIWKSFVEYFTS